MSKPNSASNDSVSPETEVSAHESRLRMWIVMFFVGLAYLACRAGHFSDNFREIEALPTTVLIAWISCQSADRLRAAIFGLMYLVVLEMIFVLGSFMLGHSSANQLSTLLQIDVPSEAIELTKMVCVLRLASMMFGIDIASRDAPILRRWTIHNLLVAIASFAILFTTLQFSSRFFEEMVFISSDTSEFRESHRLQFLLFGAANLALVPVVPVLGAAWLCAGRGRRWWFLPAVILVAIGARFLQFWWSEYVLFRLPYFKSLGLSHGLGRHGIWIWMAGIEACICCLCALLVPFVGLRWRDGRYRPREISAKSKHDPTTTFASE